MKKVNLLKVFIASPGDVSKQRDEVERLIWEWNNEHTDQSNIVLMPIRWENNSTASYRMNEDGQTVINEQILNDSDILIAIFGNKIGTRTMNGKSGTVEEINYFYNKNKRSVGIFFVDEETVPKKFLDEQKVVDAYKKYLQTNHRGMYDKFNLTKIRNFLSREVRNLDTDFSENKTTLPLEKVQMDISTMFDEIEFDEDERLLLLFIGEMQVRELGARWREVETTAQIKKWEKENNLCDTLSQNYNSTLYKLEEKNLIYPKEYTEPGNVKLFFIEQKVYKSLKATLKSNIEKVAEVKERNTVG